jgi:hypothetical protein
VNPKTFPAIVVVVRRPSLVSQNTRRIDTDTVVSRVFHQQFPFQNDILLDVALVVKCYKDP